jgi:SAM-dependent methyltransferase
VVTRAAYPGVKGGALREYREGRRHDPRWARANWGHHAFLTQAFESIAKTLAASGLDLYADDAVLGIGPSGARFVEYLRRSGDPGPAVRAVSLSDDGTLPVPDDSVRAVVLSLVLSEMPSPLARAQVARECRRVLAPDGVVVCWDARLPNPRNPHVDAIGRRELARLFPESLIESRSLTLIPQVARSLGAATPFLYSPLESIPVLRSHLLATIRVGSG